MALPVKLLPKSFLTTDKEQILFPSIISGNIFFFFCSQNCPCNLHLFHLNQLHFVGHLKSMKQNSKVISVWLRCNVSISPFDYRPVFLIGDLVHKMWKRVVFPAPRSFQRKVPTLLNLIPKWSWLIIDVTNTKFITFSYMHEVQWSKVYENWIKKLTISAAKT